MKTHLYLIGIITVLSMISCENKYEPEKFTLTGTYWAYEHSISTSSVRTWYYYDVWHFISETEAIEIEYDSELSQVDIKSGEDPAKYREIMEDSYETRIHVSSFEYPNITIYEERINKETGEVTIDEARRCNGEFLLNDKVLSVKFPISGYYRHFYRINK